MIRVGWQAAAELLVLVEAALQLAFPPQPQPALPPQLQPAPPQPPLPQPQPVLLDPPAFAPAPQLHPQPLLPLDTGCSGVTSCEGCSWYWMVMHHFCCRSWHDGGGE